MVSRARQAALALAVALGGAAGGAETPPAAPARVVSINLCTDQLAMLLAAPGQLVAVSRLALDPQASAMSDVAGNYPITSGGAEEVFLLRPDLVLAGTFSTPATVALLRRLGIPVVQFAPPSSLADVETQIRDVGAALGRGAEAEAMVASLRAGLRARRAGDREKPRAALYSASGWTGGRDTLAGEVLDAAGFSNVAVEAGLSGGGYLRLEQLVMLAPDLVVTGTRYPGHSRSEETLDHPILDHLHRSAPIRGADWVCGTPHLLRALDLLLAERAALGR